MINIIEEMITNPWIVGICTSVIASIIVSLIWLGRKRYCSVQKSVKVFSWLRDNTEDIAGEQFKSTTEISKALQMDEDHVRNICSQHKNIFEHARQKDSWSVFGNEPKSVYEERGILRL